MISKLSSGLLNDTLHIMQLAKQAALARGNQERASKLSTVADGLYRAATSGSSSATSSVYDNQTATSQSLTGGLMAQDGFSTLLSALQNGTTVQKSSADQQAVGQINTTQKLFSDRNQIVVAMASGGTNELDIARQFGITRDEVRTILSLNTPQKSKEISGIGESK